MEIPKPILTLWRQLSQFVRVECADRDESHGYDHMKKVAYNSLKIFTDLYDYIDSRNLYIAKLVVVTAWLHDVADHKYDKDGLLKIKVSKFVHKLYKNDHKTTRLVLNIIDRIPFSRENVAKQKNIPSDWNTVLGKTGVIVRNIVSDADKLEAIGEEGVNRCITYTIEKYKEKTGSIGMDYDLLVKEVKEHADEKLLKLRDEFIRTKPGKKMANKLHSEMVEVLDAL